MSASRADSSRPFGVVSLTMLVIAGMIGAGVFTTSGFTLATVGTPARVMVCWAIGGILALCGAVAYGRLAKLLPESGGEYLYLHRHVHPAAGFLAGWVSLTAGFSGAIATAAVAFERYAIPESLWPDGVPPDTAALGLIVACGLLHANSVRRGTAVHNTVVVLKVLALTIFLLAALLAGPQHSWHWRPSPEQTQSASQQSWPALAVSVVWISLSYAGFNAAVYVSSESRQAQRLVPRALVLGTALVTLLYLALNLVFVTAQPFPVVAGEPDVAAIAARAIGGSRLELLIRVAVCLGLVSSVSGMIVTGPRVYARMADDGVFPRWFQAEQGGIRRAVVLQMLISALLIVLQRLLVSAELLQDSLLGLLDYLGTTLSITSACCVATLFLPGVRRADVGRRRLIDLAAVVYVCGTLLAVVLMVSSHRVDGQLQAVRHGGGAAITFISGLLVWLIVARRRQSA